MESNKAIVALLFCLLKFYVSFTVARDIFKTEYKWTQIEFAFPSETEREEAINNGTFKEGTVQPIDVQVYYSGNKRTVFITCPRVSDGIPATFGTVTDKLIKGNPAIDPYPNWEWQTDPEKCKKHRIVSVFRVFIDNCNRLWIIDNGIVGETQVCPPQLLAFDLKTNSLVRKFEIPFDQHKNTSLYLTPVVESNPKNCKDAFVYVADAVGYSLLVYDVKNDNSWRIFDESFNPDPNYETYVIDGESFQLMDGILGLALSPPQPGRKLFYHAMSSGTENWVYTKYLKNKSLFSGSSAGLKIFHTYPKKRKTQSAAEAMDKSGILYFGLLGEIKIASWNIRLPYDDKYFKIIGDNKKTMQFPSGMKVIPNENRREELWIFSTAYQRLATGKLFSNQTNFIILSAKLSYW